MKQIAAQYSHLNGHEYLLVHHPELWEEMQAAIESVDADSCRTKVSKEKRMADRLLLSPTDMNRAFRAEFQSRGWSERRQNFWVTDDETLLRDVYTRSEMEQKRIIQEAGREPYSSYNQTDFVKTASPWKCSSENTLSLPTICS